MQITTGNFVLVMITMAGLGAGAALGKANLQSAAQEPSSQSTAATAAAAGEPFVYFPSQYPVEAPSQPNEHIQAF